MALRVISYGLQNPTATYNIGSQPGIHVKIRRHSVRMKDVGGRLCSRLLAEPRRCRVPFPLLPGVSDSSRPRPDHPSQREARFHNQLPAKKPLVSTVPIYS